jgi:TM2 domain-containing membrane protein YozV
MEQNNVEISPFSRKKAFWLCLAYGVSGFHRLYCGKVWTGIFQWVIFVFATEGVKLTSDDWGYSVLYPLGWVMFVVMFGWYVLDLILIISRDFRDNEGRKVSNGGIIH